MRSKTEIYATAIYTLLDELNQQGSWGQLGKGDSLNEKLSYLAEKHSRVCDSFIKKNDPRDPRKYTPSQQPIIFEYMAKEASDKDIHNFIIDFSLVLLETRDKKNILTYIRFSNENCLEPVFTDNDEENIQILNDIHTFSSFQLIQMQKALFSYFFNKGITSAACKETATRDEALEPSGFSTINK